MEKDSANHWIYCGECDVPLTVHRPKKLGQLWKFSCPGCNRIFVCLMPPAGGAVDGKPPFMSNSD